MPEEKATTPPPAKTKDDNATGKKPQNQFGKGRGNRNRKQREPKEFEETILQIDRVTRVVKGGRRMRFRVSIVIGDKKGRVGFGMGKAAEVMGGVQKGVSNAKRNLFSVPVFEDSIPHEVIGKFKATKILLFPAPEGTGVIAGGAVRKILELSGVKNVLSKAHGSRNAINMAHATFDALTQLQNRTPQKKEEVEEPKAEKEATENAETPKKAKTEEKKPKATTKKETAKKPTKKTTKKK